MKTELDKSLTDTGLRLSGPGSGKQQTYSISMYEIIAAGRFLADNFEPANKPFKDMNSFELSRKAARWMIDNELYPNETIVMTNAAILQAAINANIKFTPALYPGLDQSINAHLFISKKEQK